MADIERLIGDDDAGLESLVVSVSDVQGQVIEALQYYLSGRWDEKRTWAKIGPLYEFSASPTAEQAMVWFDGYTSGVLSKTEFRRCLEEMVSEMKNAGH